MSFRKWTVRIMGLVTLSLLAAAAIPGQAAAEPKSAGEPAFIPPPKQLSPAETEETLSAEISLADPVAENLAIEVSLANYWSPWISEEDPPFSCQNGYLIDFMQCGGRYCDNIAVRCYNTARDYGYSYWTSYFSEEGTYYRYCANSSFMTGLNCKGSYCDNVSIKCTYPASTRKGNCYWTSWFSEEYPGWRYLGDGYYAAGLACSGRYCDNKSVYACQAL